MSTSSGDTGRGSQVYAQSQPQPYPQPQQSSRHTELISTSREQQKQQQPPTKRRRIGYACNLCRTKKNRCDGERPSCGPCKERRQECVYSPQRTKISVTQEYVDPVLFYWLSSSGNNVPFQCNLTHSYTFRYIENLRARNRMLEDHLAGQQTQGSQSP
jgi:hypothetical protein